MVYSVISALGRQKWKNCHKFNARQDYIVRTCLKRPKTIKHVGVRCVERIAMQIRVQILSNRMRTGYNVMCVISALGSGDRSRWSFSSAKPISREFCVQWETLSQKYREWLRKTGGVMNMHTCVHMNKFTAEAERSWVNSKWIFALQVWLGYTIQEEWDFDAISVLARCHVIHFLCFSFQPNLVLCLSVPFQGSFPSWQLS